MRKPLIYVAGILFLLSLCFVLPATAFTLTSPNGGENWQAGTTHTISWTRSIFDYTDAQINLYERTCSKLPSGVTICIDSLKKTITPHASVHSGSSSWYIPTNQAPGTYYKIELKSNSVASNYDRSDGYFTIAGVKVITPNGGENVVRGTPFRIKWYQAGLTGTNVKVDLWKYPIIVGQSPSKSPIVASVSAEKGYYDWTPPIPQIAILANYRVEVTDLTYPTLHDMSDGTFQLSYPSAATITVTSPACGVVWKPGTPHTVTWTYTGNPGPNVKVVLMKAGVDVGTATYSTPTAAGSYLWAISSGRAPGTDYQIRVESTSNPSVKGTSCMFTIGEPSTTPTIKVTSPNSAVVWKRGTTHPVTWTYTGDPGPNVKIELLQGPSYGPVGTATYSTPTATGSYPWAISSGRAPGMNYRIRVTSVSKPTVTDTSDVDFTITA